MSTLRINDNNRYTVDTLYQWDINQELFIYGLNVSKPEIHFANEVMSSSLVVRGSVDSAGVISVNIPNSLLQKPYSVTAYICGYEGSTFKTYCKVVIPMKKRKRPGDYTIETSDGELYSFLELSRRVSDLENSIEEKIIGNFYSYTYDSSNSKLRETSGTYTVSKCLGLTSSSLKAIKSLTDKFKSLIDSNKANTEQALAIAKGRNQAHVFNTTADMESWLSDENNKGLYNVGDNLYIVDTSVPDWWIQEVLDEQDGNTGFYYKVSQLETQKVDLTNIETDLSDLKNGVTVWTNDNITAEFPAQTISHDFSNYSRVKIILQDQMSSFREVECSVKDIYYIVSHSLDMMVYSRRFLFSDTGITFADGKENSTISNHYYKPYQIIAYKY